MCRRKIIGFVLVASMSSVALVGQVSCGHAQVEGLDDLYRSRRDRTWDDRDGPRDLPDRDFRRERRDRLFTDRDGCRGGAGVEGLDCDGRRHRRDHRDAHHDNHGRNEWRDFDPRHSRGWGSGDPGGSYGRGQGQRGARGFQPPLRDYGGGDFDGAPRGLGLPYWAPD